MVYLHFTTSDFLIAAMSYLGQTSDSSDEALDYSAAFAGWLRSAYSSPQAVMAWDEALERFERDGGMSGWRDTIDARHLAQEDAAAARASGITWAPGARRWATQAA